jgi:hypothetical protein
VCAAGGESSPDAVPVVPTHEGLVGAALAPVAVRAHQTIRTNTVPANKIIQFYIFQKRKGHCKLPVAETYNWSGESSSNLIEYLREFESVCKSVLAHESGDPGYSLTKNRGSKIS